MKMLFCAVVLLCCSASGWAQRGDEFSTGRDFLRECGPQTPSKDSGLRAIEEGAAPVVDTACNMYTFGVYKGIDHVADLMDGIDPSKSHRYICVPDGTTAISMRDIVVRFIKAHLGLSGVNTNRLISSALSEAFPCQANKPPQP
jgi:hypothetical protein